jgi:hypothetical protein
MDIPCSGRVDRKQPSAAPETFSRVRGERHTCAGHEHVMINASEKISRCRGREFITLSVLTEAGLRDYPGSIRIYITITLLERENGGDS